MYEVLAQALEQVLPPGVTPEGVIRRHVWYDSLYVGTHQGKAVRWIGWYANLRPILKYYGTIYCDYIPNTLSHEENLRLFGEQFAQAIRGMSSFVCVFMTGCSIKVRESLVQEGYTVRVLSKNSHPAIIERPDVFTVDSVDMWVSRVLALLEAHKKFCGRHNA